MGRLAPYDLYNSFLRAFCLLRAGVLGEIASLSGRAWRLWPRSEVLPLLHQSSTSHQGDSRTHKPLLPEIGAPLSIYGASKAKRYGSQFNSP